MIFQLLEKVFLNPSTRFFSSDRSSLLPQFLRWCGDFYLLIQSSPGRSSAFTPSFHNFFETLHNIFLFLIEVHYCFSFYDFISKTKFSWQELCLSPPFHSPLGCNCRSHYRIPTSHDLQHSHLSISSLLFRLGSSKNKVSNYSELQTYKRLRLCIAHHCAIFLLSSFIQLGN